jgi:hypothetical protein
MTHRVLSSDATAGLAARSQGKLPGCGLREWFDGALRRLAEVRELAMLNVYIAVISGPLRWQRRCVVMVAQLHARGRIGRHAPVARVLECHAIGTDGAAAVAANSSLE